MQVSITLLEEAKGRWRPCNHNIYGSTTRYKKIKPRSIRTMDYNISHVIILPLFIYIILYLLLSSFSSTLLTHEGKDEGLEWISPPEKFCFRIAAKNGSGLSNYIDICGIMENSMSPSTTSSLFLLAFLTDIQGLISSLQPHYPEVTTTLFREKNHCFRATVSTASPTPIRKMIRMRIRWIFDVIFLIEFVYHTSCLPPSLPFHVH